MDTYPCSSSCPIGSLGFLRNSRYPERKRLFLSTKSESLRENYNASGSTQVQNDDIDESSLPLEDQIRDAYMSGETDGVLNIAPRLLNRYDAMELVHASMSSFSEKKGQAAGIINALIGGCCSDDAPNPNMAWDLLQSFDSMSKETGIYPDLVTYCNVYTSFFKGTDQGDQNLHLDDNDRANEVLERAKRYSKKIAGSKRRRAVVKARNKKGSNGKNNNKLVQARDILEDFKADYGQDFEVLFEDNDILVLSKPSGMVCFHKRKTTAGKVNKKNKKSKETKYVENARDISLEDALMDKGIPLSTLNPEAMGIVHRIDRGTSGCIVLAKNDPTHALLVTEFFTRKAKKSYLALTPKNDHIDDTGTIHMIVDKRPAISKYTILQKFDNAMLLQVETLTGRKHQVRIHCADGLNSPIFLDPLYSRTIDVSDIPEPIRPIYDGTGKKFFLHASTISLPSLKVEVKSPMPLFWTQALQEL